MQNNSFKLSALLIGVLSSTSVWAQDTNETTIDESIEVVGDFQKQTITQTTRSIAIVDENSMHQRASRHLQDVLNSSTILGWVLQRHYSMSDKWKFTVVHKVGALALTGWRVWCCSSRISPPRLPVVSG